MKKIIILALALLLALGLCAAALGEGYALPSVKQFNATTLYGDEYTQEALAEVDLTVVNVWSITCQPCIQEMPELATLGRRLPENVRLIAVCPDALQAEDAVKEFLEKVGFESETLVSGDGDLAALVGSLMYTPTTLFLDAEGNQVSEPMIGSPEDVESAYLAAINEALAALGKPAITLGAEAE